MTMGTRFLLILALALPACTTARFEKGADGTVRLSVTRFASDVTAGLSSDGTLTYTSDADTQAAVATTEKLVDGLLTLARPAPSLPMLRAPGSEL